MAGNPENRVAVYIDFDNIVISRYDQVHGRGAWRKDNVYRLGPGLTGATDEQLAKIRAATVDISAILDYATSFGDVVVSRAYADWSVGVNASYQGQLMERAVDLTQLFPATAQMKNGADIRLAVDVIEDLFRLPDITHVVIAAGDSDYIPLAQRAKRLGRYVVGVGVAGGTSKSLAAACNEFADYDSMPGIRPAKHIAAELDDAVEPPATAETPAKDAPKKASRRASSGGSAASASVTSASQKTWTKLLMRALQQAHEREVDSEWVHASEVKNLMVRLDPSFNEKALGFGSFSEFVKSRNSIAALDESNQVRMIRLRQR
ncbi:MAG: NYN domain-containing protein [Actinomycetes bacterium]